MIEKRQEIGASLRCAEGISKKGLDAVEIPVDRRWVSAEVAGAKIVSPNGSVFRIDESHAGDEVGMVLERHLFDKALAAKAAHAGAEIKLKLQCHRRHHGEGQGRRRQGQRHTASRSS